MTETEHQEPNPEFLALEAGLFDLQQLGATRRCLHVVIKRLRDLPQRSRAEFEIFVKHATVPGFRPGKARAEMLPRLAATSPTNDRRLFRFAFAFWVELFQGLPESVAEAAKRVAPEIDLECGAWSEIVTAVPLVASQMPRHQREDVLLALFANRFLSVIAAMQSGEICPGCGGNHARVRDDATLAESASYTDETGTEAAQHLPVDGALVPGAGSSIDRGAPGTTQPVSISEPVALSTSSVVEPGSEIAVRLETMLTELNATDASDMVWDVPAERFLASLAQLRLSKLQSRAYLVSRAPLIDALEGLRTTEALEELDFLRIRSRCAVWVATAVPLADVTAVSIVVSAIVGCLSEHRVARLGAQQAESDELFETHTATRQAAKRRLLGLIEDVEPRLQPPVTTAIQQVRDSAVADAIEQPCDVPSVPQDEAAVAPPSAAAPNADGASSDAIDEAAAQIVFSVPDGEALPVEDRTSYVAASEETHAETVDREIAPTSDSTPIEANGAIVAEVAVSQGRTPTADLIEPVSSIRQLPSEIISYAHFRENYWIGAGSIVEAAPWRSDSFVDRIRQEFDRGLARAPQRTWDLLVLASALEALGETAPIGIADLRTAAALWAAPDSPSAGLDPDRSDRLRSGRAGFGTPSQRFALVLEALRPSPDRQLLTHEIEVLVEQAAFESGALRVVVDRFLTAHLQGQDSVGLIRRASRSSPNQTRDVAASFAAARRDLQTLATRVWSAAGGRVQRTHCRLAWSEFIDRIHPSLSRLYPPPRGDDAWTVTQSLRDVDGYQAALDSICEKFGAKFDDRRRMLKTATELTDAARLVIELRKEQVSLDDGKKPTLALPELELTQLRFGRLRIAEEEFARLVLLRVLDGATGLEVPHPLAITVSDLCERPDLLRLIRDVPAESVDALRRPDGAFAYADDLSESVRAAAVRLLPVETTENLTFEGIIANLERSQRSALLGSFVHGLDDRLQRRVHAERTEALGRLANAISQISRDVEDLAQLGNRFAVAVRAIRDEARKLVEDGDLRLDTRLTEAWLERVHETGRKLVAEHVAHLSAEASRRDDSDEIRAALSQGHYGRAVRLLRGHGGIELRASRQTDWRDQAEANRETLQRNLTASPDAKIKALLDAWRSGVKGDIVRADRTLRTEFVRLVTDGRDMGRESASTHVSIPIPEISAALARDQLMPTWIPQLARFARLVVLTPPVSPEQPTFGQATLAKAGEFSRDLVVFLAPRLPGPRRSEVLREMRRRNISAALIDDLDLYRLLNPGSTRPHLMVGLLEIILEQQRRAAFSPFDLLEGSHVRLEMYVGRQDQAREIARTANYSRLFSGRKLGKSALLRFIERTEGGVKLPSGNTLRVVYVPAVGIGSESAMVDAIVASLETSSGPRFERSTEVEPSDKLGGLLRAYLEAHKTQSLLIVLDEADVFFERQLAEYDTRREQCLSFQMRSRFSAMVDEQGLPRVRFLFAGYRVTNRSQGAWSNWGRVLSLDPLEPEDAARLISAPLAVMGIDVGSHAHEIAYRCGYQPAILLRFGERLMDHLERQPHRSGERYIVSPGDLSQVLDDQRVHDEIRTIASNNFEGNPAGLIVFGALLGELLELPPGQPLRDAPQRILNRLRTLDPDFVWLEREGDGSAAVRGYLADFVERSLLKERRIGGEPSYLLRFPHHLTILASLADEVRVREEIRRLKTRSQASPENAERALVSPRALRDLGDAGQLSANAIAVVGTLWPTGTYDRAGGIPDRLGISSDETVDAQAVLNGRTMASVRAVRRVDVAAAEHVVKELSGAESRPILIGGVDLLRWAIAKRRSSNDLLYEVHGVGRLSIPRLTWWMQSVRGIEFARTDAIERIHRQTGGLPLLVDIVDSQLTSAAGTTVSDERVSLALGAVDDAIPRISRDLLTGRPAIALDLREREILQMIESIVRSDPSAGSDLASALTDVWELFADSCPIPPLSNADSGALEVLIESGLLPSNPLATREDPLARLGTVVSTDPVLAIVRAFMAERQA